MKTEVIWKVKKLPSMFALHIESTTTCDYYKLGDFPGIIAYYRNEGILKFVENRILEESVVKTVTSIISVWVGCVPYQININGKNLT